MTRRALWRGLLATTALATLGAAGVGRADVVSAHAELVSSEPSAGARLDAAPVALTLRFTESVTFVDDSLRLIDVSGAAISGVGVPTHPEGDDTVAASLPALADGGYVVAWDVVSADGHPASGAFAFVVGEGATPDASVVEGATPGTGNETPRVLLELLRAVGYLGLLLAIGLWAFVLLVDKQGATDPVLRRAVAGGGAAVVASALLRIPAQVAYTGLGWQAVVESDVGTAWIALAGVGAVLALAPLDWDRVAGAAQAVVLAALSVGAGVAVAYGGHGAVGRAHTLGLAATVVHIVATSVWVGGLLGVARRWSADRSDHRWIVAARYSTTAMVAAVVVVASGVVQSLRQLDSTSEITGTDFGRTLLVKLGLVVSLLAVAVVSRRAVGSRHGRMGRAVAGELAITVLILGATGFLAGSSPVEAGDPAQAAAANVMGNATVGDRVAAITVSPGAAGANDVDVSVFNRVDIGEVPDEMSVEIVPGDGSVGAIDLPVEAVSPSRVIARDVVFAFAGTWDVTVRARYGEFESVAFTVPVTLAP